MLYHKSLGNSDLLKAINLLLVGIIHLHRLRHFLVNLDQSATLVNLLSLLDRGEYLSKFETVLSAIMGHSETFWSAQPENLKTVLEAFHICFKAVVKNYETVQCASRLLFLSERIFFDSERKKYPQKVLKYSCAISQCVILHIVCNWTHSV